MKRVAFGLVIALAVGYIGTWLIGVPAVRAAVPGLITQELRTSARDAADRRQLDAVLAAYPPAVEFHKVYAVFPGIVVANFALQLGKRYLPQETHVILWFGVGLRFLDVRRRLTRGCSGRACARR